MSLVGEYHPRLAGYRGNLGSGDSDPLGSFGVEWRVGGHSFQLNFSNALGTTPAQVARGAQGQRGWFIGFVYLLCAAVRLARFNVITNPLLHSPKEGSKDFVGRRR